MMSATKGGEGVGSQTALVRVLCICLLRHLSDQFDSSWADVQYTRSNKIIVAPPPPNSAIKRLLMMMMRMSTKATTVTPLNSQDGSFQYCSYHYERRVVRSNNNKYVKLSAYFAPIKQVVLRTDEFPLGCDLVGPGFSRFPAVWKYHQHQWIQSGSQGSLFSTCRLSLLTASLNYSLFP